MHMHFLSIIFNTLDLYGSYSVTKWKYGAHTQEGKKNTFIWFMNIEVGVSDIYIANK